MNAVKYKEKSALDLIGFVKNGSREFERRIYGKDAIAFTENWLKTHKWLDAAVKAFKGEVYRMPIISGMADKWSQANWMKN